MSPRKTLTRIAALGLATAAAAAPAAGAMPTDQSHPAYPTPGDLRGEAAAMPTDQSHPAYPTPGDLRGEAAADGTSTADVGRDLRGEAAADGTRTAVRPLPGPPTWPETPHADRAARRPGARHRRDRRRRPRRRDRAPRRARARRRRGVHHHALPSPVGGRALTADRGAAHRAAPRLPPRASRRRRRACAPRRARRRGLDAEPAEHALVEVRLDDPQRAVLGACA